MAKPKAEISKKAHWDHHQLCFGEAVALEEIGARASHRVAVLTNLAD